MIIKFDPWTESLGICAPFEYKATLFDGTFLPNFIDFYPNLR